MKRRSVILGLVSAAALVVGGVAPAASADSRVSGFERFLLVSTSEQGNPTIVGNGPVHARGTDIAVNNHRDRFKFPAGALKIEHYATSHSESFDPRTCVGRAPESGTYQVVGGTGRYEGASGPGTYHLQVYVIGCTEGDPSNVFSLVIKAKGPLSY